MPRFYFHFASPQRFINDDQGAELPSLTSAHLHAMRLIVRTARLMDPANTERWTVQIADEWGVLLLTVLFPLSSAGVRESLQFPGSSPPENTAAVLRACAAALRAIGAEGE